MVGGVSADGSNMCQAPCFPLPAQSPSFSNRPWRAAWPPGQSLHPHSAPPLWLGPPSGRGRGASSWGLRVGVGALLETHLLVVPNVISGGPRKDGRTVSRGQQPRFGAVARWAVENALWCLTLPRRRNRPSQHTPRVPGGRVGRSPVPPPGLQPRPPLLEPNAIQSRPSALRFGRLFGIKKASTCRRQFGKTASDGPLSRRLGAAGSETGPLRSPAWRGGSAAPSQPWPGRGRGGDLPLLSWTSAPNLPPSLEGAVHMHRHTCSRCAHTQACTHTDTCTCSRCAHTQLTHADARIRPPCARPPGGLCTCSAPSQLEQGQVAPCRATPRARAPRLHPGTRSSLLRPRLPPSAAQGSGPGRL